MKNIQIKYCPFKWSGFQLTAKGWHPEAWDEITPAQLITIACLYTKHIGDVAFLNILTGIKKSILKKLDGYQLLKLFELMDFIKDLKPYNQFIIPKLGRVKELHAPKLKLKGVTFGQFIFADTYFSDYQANSKPADLNRFVASLYLPMDHSFSESTIDENEKWVSNLPADTREAIYINYLLIREWLTTVYPYIFTKYEDVKSKGLTSPPAKNTNRKNGWIKVFDSIVADDIINNDKYASLPVHTVFRFMTAKYIQNLKSRK
jgi:hypothetical protein